MYKQSPNFSFTTMMAVKKHAKDGCRLWVISSRDFVCMKYARVLDIDKTKESLIKAEIITHHGNLNL